MMKKQQGFTLIELVAVIVILGALAVVALPRFINLQTEAEQAAAEGVAGSVSAAFATNYAASLAKDSSNAYDIASGSPSGPDSFATVDASSDVTVANVDKLMTGSPVADGGYGVNCTGSFNGAGSTIDCDITHTDQSYSPTPSFTAIATS